MIALKVYNGEVFERSKWRYIKFASIVLAIVFLTLFYKADQGLQNILGALVFLMIVGGYFFFLAKTENKIELVLTSEGILVDKKLIVFPLLKGFVVEMDKKTGKLKNIVLVLEKGVEIYSLRDTPEQQERFFAELSRVIPFLEDYEQGMLDRLMRKLKL